MEDLSGKVQVLTSENVTLKSEINKLMAMSEKLRLDNVTLTVSHIYNLTQILVLIQLTIVHPKLSFSPGETEICLEGRANHRRS